MRAFKKILLCVLAVTIMLSGVGVTHIQAAEIGKEATSSKVLKAEKKEQLVDSVWKKLEISKKGMAHIVVSVIGRKNPKQTEVYVTIQHYNVNKDKWEFVKQWFEAKPGPFVKCIKDYQLPMKGRFRLRVSAVVRPKKGDAVAFVSNSETDYWK